MSVTKEFFGYTRDGQAVFRYTLTNANDMEVQVISYGAALRSARVPDRHGRLADVLLGYDSLREYELRDGFFGALVGRVANRLRLARFCIDGTVYQLQPNEGENHLHGSFSFRVLDAEMGENSLTFSFLSPDGEEGYPGNLSVTYRYTLTDDNRLTLDYTATTDNATILNLTNHAYWNLGGHDSGDVLDTVLQMNCSQFTETDRESLLTGNVFPVEGTAFDFRTPKPLGRDIDADHPMLRWALGYDLNLVTDRPSMIQPVASAYSPKTGIVMDYYTTQPGTQLYSGNYISLQPPRRGKGGVIYENRHGFCLESQHCPCATDFPQFDTTVLRPGEVYRQSAAYQFSVKK